MSMALVSIDSVSVYVPDNDLVFSVKNTFLHVVSSMEDQMDRTRSLTRTRSEPVLLQARAETAPAILQDAQEGSMLDASSGSQEEKKRLLHALGICKPCSYFAFKADGCRQGDSCAFCHFCTEGEAKDRRRHLKHHTKVAIKST
eukprot:CAMPEP_0115088456 /NCGR_PEP_ID=MMETSP0227-20121206/24005_1 /TAXON_ID=89957 /ORGANISM="Polarella glacialis, Strain CCMP 1383" /LENGTH=143 /DNA_ID=CAMNT_0002478735 /DNA_START=70 /DNA_END=501 /DNA_ORIENTATION=-